MNVTAACRRRRNFEFEKPEILTFDEDIDETIDLAFRNAFHQKQFVPTKTLRYLNWECNYFSNWIFISFSNSMEVTPLVVLPHFGRHPSSFNQHSGLYSSYPMYSLNSRNKSPQLHPSLFQDESKYQQQQQHRIFFSALSLANFFNNRGSVTYTTFKTGKLNWNVLYVS